MLIDFDKAIEDLKGEVIKDEKGEVLTVQTLLYQAAVTTFQDDKFTNKEAMEMFSLAKKVVDKSELSVDEVAMLKKRFEKLPWPIVIKGRVISILESV